MTDEPHQPRYRVIEAELTRRIEANTYPVGSLLPSEMALAQEFGVTRMTVRQALSRLAALGAIERRHGHGTTVAPIKLRRLARRPIGLAEELLAHGLTPGARVLKIDEIRPSADLREAIWIGPRGTVFRLRRLRYADGVLIGVQESIVPVRHAPGLDQLDLTDRSLTAILRDRYDRVASRAVLSIEAVAADRVIAAQLKIPVGAPVLRSTRLSYLASGQPLERTIGWFLGNRYSYRLHQGPGSTGNRTPGSGQRL
ncbi:MAG TPA: GntR family transcriptional regulator [Candidatus Saccharimonadales bacterium]|nr:GntR family transcriptional regulator [Candidatus Saccharimonadales bacterium]